jgi:hypothetical protein
MTRVTERGILTLGFLFACTASAWAQAWVAPEGVGAVTVVYQGISNTGHRLADGSMLRGYDSLSRGVLLEIDYAFTDRLSVSAGTPYIAAKYSGPLASFSGLPLDDCNCWNQGWQDFSATARYNLANDAWALTPSVSFGIPTHNYSYFGEAVLGRNLNEVRVAVDVGRRLDAISPRVAVQGQYSYAFVERVFDYKNDRSNIALQTSYLLTRRMSVRGLLSWQRTHGGLSSNEFVTQELFEQFDRLLRDNSFHVGGGLSYSLPRVDIFAVYVGFAGGRDTHAGRAITVGLSLPFELP